MPLPLSLRFGRGFAFSRAHRTARVIPFFEWVAVVAGLVAPATLLAAEPNSSNSKEPTVAVEAEAEDETKDDESQESKSSEHENSGDDDLQVTTVGEATSPTTDPRHPSGWITRVEPDDSFERGDDLAGALDRVEGVTTRRRSSLGQPAFASVRGGSPRQLSVHLNGIRIGAPAGVGFDLSSVSTGWLDGVDVYRGAAGAPWGSGALTGSLNLLATPPDSTGWSTSAALVGGSFGTVGVETEAAGGTENLRGDVNANWRKSRGNFEFRDDQGELHTRANNDHEQLSAGGTLGGNLAGGELEGALLHHRSDRGTPGPSEFQQSYEHARIESRRTLGTLGFRRRGVAEPDWGVVDLKLGGGGMHRPFHYTNSSTFLSGSSRESHAYKTTVASTGRMSTYFDAGNITHLDLEARSSHYRVYGGADTDSELAADRQTFALGLSDELLLFDADVSLIAGLRAELVREQESNSTPLIPAGGLIWRATDDLRLQANISRSHRTPGFDELYLRTEMIRGNPNLDPERALNVDAGLVLGSEEGPVRASATVYRSDFRDMILFLPQTAYLFQAENLRSATTRGVESSATLELGERFRTRGSYTFTDAFLDSAPDVQLPHHPRHRGSISNRLELAGLGPLDALRGLEIRADAGARSGLNLDNFGNLRNSPYWQVDLGATLRPNATLAFGLHVRNVTDNRRGADYLQRPLPGRSIYASVRYHDGTIEP